LVRIGQTRVSLGDVVEAFREGASTEVHFAAVAPL
jgi:hypothetical protein